MANKATIARKYAEACQRYIDRLRDGRTPKEQLQEIYFHAVEMGLMLNIPDAETGKRIQASLDHE